MSGVMRVLYLLAEIVWIGEIIFFSFIGAPAVFRNLPPVDAGRVVGAIFPVYYVIGYVCGAVMLGAGLYLSSDMIRRTEWMFGSFLVALMLAATMYAGLVIQPRAAALRPQIHDPAAAETVKPEFDRLHKLAVQLNGGVLLGGLVLVVLTARSLR